MIIHKMIRLINKSLISSIFKSSLSITYSFTPSNKSCTVLMPTDYHNLDVHLLFNPMTHWVVLFLVAQRLLLWAPKKFETSGEGEQCGRMRSLRSLNSEQFTKNGMRPITYKLAIETTATYKLTWGISRCGVSQSWSLIHSRFLDSSRIKTSWQALICKVMYSLRIQGHSIVLVSETRIFFNLNSSMTQWLVVDTPRPTFVETYTPSSSVVNHAV